MYTRFGTLLPFVLLYHAYLRAGWGVEVSLVSAKVLNSMSNLINLLQVNQDPRVRENFESENSQNEF